MHSAEQVIALSAASHFNDRSIVTEGLGLRALYRSVAGIDVHRMLHVVTVRIEQPDGSMQRLTREFGGFRRDCRALAAWLGELGVELVIMQSDVRTQIGVLGRTVRDVALAWPLLAGVDGQDSGVVPMPLPSAVPVKLAALRVALYTDDDIAPPTPETAEALQAAGDALRSAGIAVERARPVCLHDAAPITQR